MKAAAAKIDKMTDADASSSAGGGVSSATKVSATSGPEATDRKGGARNTKSKKQQLLQTIKPPKVYFMSRTHSQLAQVVKELKSCGAYHACEVTVLEPATLVGGSEPSAAPTVSPEPVPVKSSLALEMTVLASREHACIHPTVSVSKTRDEVVVSCGTVILAFALIRVPMSFRIAMQCCSLEAHPVLIFATCLRWR
jgi:hypothetical protein